ncbi:hypothetical protein [Polaribacter sp.]
MRKTQQSFLSKIVLLSRRKQERKEPRNYTALVEIFKTKVQVQ